MKLTMLGTGNAAVTKCYNTCFILSENGNKLLVDAGGGNGIFRQLQAVGEDWHDLRDIFVSHKHIDHLMGIIWMLRMILQGMSRGSYEGEARIYAHEELLALLHQLAELLLTPKETAYIGKRLHFVPLFDGESRTLLDRPVTFFDIHSEKAKQFGFALPLEKGRLCCCGEEPYHESEEVYAKGADWLLHEAFCLYSQAERFKPYQKHHSTVRDACEQAEKLGVKNLVLYHTEDENIQRRKALYTEEGKAYFSGRLLIPDDLESIELS